MSILQQIEGDEFTLEYLLSKNINKRNADVKIVALVRLNNIECAVLPSLKLVAIVDGVLKIFNVNQHYYSILELVKELDSVDIGFNKIYKLSDNYRLDVDPLLSLKKSSSSIFTLVCKLTVADIGYCELDLSRNSLRCGNFGKKYIIKNFIEKYRCFEFKEDEYESFLMHDYHSNGVFDVLLKDFRRRFSISSDRAISMSLERQLRNYGKDN